MPTLEALFLGGPVDGMKMPVEGRVCNVKCEGFPDNYAARYVRTKDSLVYRFDGVWECFTIPMPSSKAVSA
jgi:hypothetical protein